MALVFDVLADGFDGSPACGDEAVGCGPENGFPVVGGKVLVEVFSGKA